MGKAERKTERQRETERDKVPANKADWGRKETGDIGGGKWTLSRGGAGALHD